MKGERERKRENKSMYNIPRDSEGKNSGCDHGTVGEKGRSGRQFPARRSGPLQCRIFRRRCGCTRDATLTRSHPASRLPSRVLLFLRRVNYKRRPVYFGTEAVDPGGWCFPRRISILRPPSASPVLERRRWKDGTDGKTERERERR